MSRLIIVAMLAGACGGSSVSRFRDVNGFPVPTWAALDSVNHQRALHCNDGEYWIVSDPRLGVLGGRGVNGRFATQIGDINPKALCTKIEAY